MIRRVASMPFMPGRRTSIEMTSGLMRDTRRSAFSPLSTAHTTLRRGSELSVSTISSRATAKSSTTMTDMFFIAQMICLMVRNNSFWSNFCLTT